MYMNLKPNQQERISFNTTMTSLGFIGPPKILGPPFEIFRFPPKIGGGLLTCMYDIYICVCVCVCMYMYMYRYI